MSNPESSEEKPILKPTRVVVQQFEDHSGDPAWGGTWRQKFEAVGPRDSVIDALEKALKFLHNQKEKEEK